MDSKPALREHVFWHEVRSPAGTLATLLDVMNQGFAGEAPEGMRDLLARAVRQSARLTAMIAAAHDLIRLKNGRLVVRREPVDLARAAREAAALAAPAAAAKALRLTLPEGACPVVADPALVGRCAETLLRAAIDGSAKSGVVAVSAARGALEARVEEPTSLAALAEAFSAESSLGLRGGLGIGLFEARLLVEAMGGTGRGEGNRLVLTWPAPP